LDYPEIRLYVRQSNTLTVLSEEFGMILENPRERFIAHQVVPTTASGLQG
jgi:hypothetical protein